MTARTRELPSAAPLHPLRVAIVNDALTVGGAERVAVDIANSLDRRSHTVAFCSTRIGGPLRDALREDIAVEILDRSATWDPRGMARFARFLDEHRIDVIHSHGRGTMKFVALCRQTGLTDARHVAHDHFGWLHLDRGISRGLRWALRNHTDAYLGVDTRLCRWAIDTAGMDPRRVDLQRSGVDLDRFVELAPIDPRPEFGLGDDDFVVTMIANFRPQKDHPTLFRAMSTLSPDMRRRCKLVICGATDADPEYYARCIAMLDQLGLRDNVVVAGSRPDAIALVAGSDAAILSSKNETGPLVVLEYMATATPFVATNTGQITAAVDGLGVGLVPAPRDHHDLGAALATLISMTPDERTEMGARGARAARDLFSQSRAVGHIERVYRRVMSDTLPVQPPSFAPDRWQQSDAAAHAG